MTLSADDWMRIGEVLEAALERAPDERQAFLDASCRSEPEIRREVESLLRYESGPESLLDEFPCALHEEPEEASGDRPTLVGRALSHYVILDELGRGGMGEVYRARDGRLGREVAIKVLPEAFSRNDDRRARFEREARLLAALNHPHVATIHGLEEVRGVRFLAMELVPGETLSKRISAGPIPVVEALPIFKQVAEALESAHDRGIVHRDLKPGNVKITPEGTVKVLDFGLAIALEHEGDEASPSVSSRPGTPKASGFLGTAPYMSPEQARGERVDARTDIWSFGCLMYEALTGRSAFEGETLHDVLGAILEEEPDWTALPPSMPPQMRRLLKRSLRKNVRERFHHMADVRHEIEDAMEPSVTADSAASRDRSREIHPAVSRRIGIGVGIVIAASAATLLLRRPIVAVDARPIHFDIRPASDQIPDMGLSMRNTRLAISPDGSRIVYVALTGGSTCLVLRELDNVHTRVLPNSEGAVNPFFSPDGKWVGFIRNGNALERISVDGGGPEAIAHIANVVFSNAAWGPDDTVIFYDGGGLKRVAARGGQITELTHTEPGERHRLRQVILETGQVLYSVGRRLVLLTLRTGESTVIDAPDEAVSALYLSTGHLVYPEGIEAGSGKLLAAPFDLASARMMGAPVSVLPNVFVSYGSAMVAVSENGTLVYAPGLTQKPEVVLVDRSGSAVPLLTARGAYMHPRFSPDGKWLGIGMRSHLANDIWMIDVERGVSTRLTTGGDNVAPVWKPDGSSLSISRADRTYSNDLYAMPVDASAEPTPLLERLERQWPTDWTPDSKDLFFIEQHPDTGVDLWVLKEDGSTEPILKTPFNEISARISPDGKWIAYTSDESGRLEVYVQAYPGPGGRRLVSKGGGGEPVWSRDGRELFYQSGRRLMAVAVRTEGELVLGTPRVLFEGDYDATRGGIPQYDVTPDGTHFAMIRVSEDETRPLRVVVNWHQELEDLAPVSQ